MEPQLFSIDAIPCALWGTDASRVIIAVHGAQSHKTDVPFQVLSKVAAGCQVLSFDLPEHGDRQNMPTLCKPQACIQDLSTVFSYAEGHWRHIGLFAVSMGAYFSLLACGKHPIEHAWLLSPVVDMKILIQDMMTWSHVSLEQLERRQSIPTSMGQTLYWDYWCYVRDHPIDHWPIPTDILIGNRDTLCVPAVTAAFAERFSCRLQHVECAEHWFHTPEDLHALAQWLRESGSDFIR